MSKDWTRRNRICETCGKPRPDEKTLRKICIRSAKEGFYILDPVKTQEAAYCLCKTQIMSRLASIRRRRSRIKRMIPFVVLFPPEKWRSRQFLLQRGSDPEDKSQKKALRRYLQSEDLVLWDWELYDSSGKTHHLEDILDTPLLKDLVGWSRKSLPRMHRILSQLATDETLVSLALTPEEPMFERVETWPDLEELWRRRLDEEE